jgi:hypothetical protein
MSRSLIRKNQLHPDIAELISGYGNDFFVTPGELEQAIINVEAEIPLQTIVYTSGNQNIGGVKNFTSRPTFNGIGIATTGETGGGGGGSIAFSGNRKITRSSILDVTPGGNDVVTFLNNLFYPFVQAHITLDSFNTIYELGNTLSSITYGGNINLGSLNLNQITNLRLVVNNTDTTPVQSTLSSTNFSFSADINLAGTAANIFVRANSVNENNQAVTIISLPNRSINFEAPWYYGSGAANLSPSQIQSLFIEQLRKVELKSNKTVTVTANNQKIYFAYPASWLSLTSIKDGNDFENLNGWLNRTNLNFTLANGATHPYIVRETSLFNTYTEPFEYTFIF